MAPTPRRGFLVLAIALDTAKPDAEVLCELRRRYGGGDEPVDGWRFTAAQLGLPERLDRRRALGQGYSFALPEEALVALQNRVKKEEAGAPLWLLLERPAGYLRLVPWEQLLERLGVPILRLPDLETAAPRESPATLDVILCGSGPIAKESFGIGECLERLASRIREGAPRRTLLHVFTDQAAHSGLRERLAAAGALGDAVRLYDPVTAGRYAVPDPALRIEEPLEALENPWLLWMRDSLGGRSVDVVHFLTHGYLAGERGALALAESPLRNEDRRQARFVGAGQLSAFLTQVGAWSAAFSSPEYNYSEMGLRLLADAVAQARPGPVLHHEMRLDPECAALARAYRFLYGAAGTDLAAVPPASPALVLYCALPRPPRRTRGQTRGISFGSPEAAASEGLQAVFDRQENVPAWVAAASRSIEQYDLRLQRLAAAPHEAGVAASRRAAREPAEEALRQIEEIVTRAAMRGDLP